MEELGLGESLKGANLRSRRQEEKDSRASALTCWGGLPAAPQNLRELPLAADRLLWAMAVSIHLVADDLLSTSSG